MSAYKCLANYYNRFTTEDADYNKWAQFILRNISATAKKGVDLACGTGKMTRILASNRLDVTGMDSSQEMLSQATAQGGKCRYVQQSLQNFQTPSQVDFVTVVNDGVNYLKPTETANFFANVYGALKLGGTFIFPTPSAAKPAWCASKRRKRPGPPARSRKCWKDPPIA